MFSMLRRCGLRAALAGVAAMLACNALAARDVETHGGEPLRLSLHEAQSLAESNNPSLRLALAQLEVAQAARDEAASLFQANPSLTGELGRRSVEGQNGRDWSMGIAQEVEIGGQPRLRREAAAFELDAARASIDEQRRTLAAEVERRFQQLLALQTRRDAEADALRLVEQSAELVRKRHGAGEGTRLETNLAEVETARYRNQVAMLDEQLVQARSAFSQALQLAPGTHAIADGELHLTPLPPTAEALAEGVRERPLLRGLALREQSAARRLALERASRTPNLTLGLSTGQEGVGIVAESITTFSVSLPLPLFKRNQAGIAQAASDLLKAQADLQSTLRNARADVMALLARARSLERRAATLERDVLPRLEENLSLSRKALAAGEVSLPEILLVNRQAMETRLDLHQAILDHELVRIDLQQAAGLAPRKEQP
jgi:cobalt-zinc-cadmium efflux system outer membrane protein